MLNRWLVDVRKNRLCEYCTPRNGMQQGAITKVTRRGPLGWPEATIDGATSVALDDIMKVWKCPTPADIKAACEADEVGDHKFFTRNNMKFAGDKMSNFGTCIDEQGRIVLYRRSAVKRGITGYGWVWDPQAKTLRSIPKPIRSQPENV